MLTEEDNTPESLLDICFSYLVTHLDSICSYDPTNKYYKLYPGIALPRELCEKFVDFYHLKKGVLDDKFIKIFNDSSITNLKRMCIKSSSISDTGLQVLLKHNLEKLDVEKCKKVTKESLTLLNEHGDNLEDLIIGYDVDLLPNDIKTDSGYILKTPKLRRLVIRHLMPNLKDQEYFKKMLSPLHNLIHLDLSGCTNIENISFLGSMQTLEFLILHNVFRVEDGLSEICKLERLRHLDISQSGDRRPEFTNENETLSTIVKSLPKLTSLDISGTNLAGTGVAESGYCGLSDIAGLTERINNPLRFLGLYGTLNGACRRHDIPALMISGDANENQILIAATAYLDRPEVLQKVLNDLYHMFRFEQCGNVVRALNVVLDAMDRHISDKNIQISGSATLFYIVKIKDVMPLLSTKIRQKVIRCLLNGMSMYMVDETMLRNGCLTLCQFRIPQDVLFEYERLVELLLQVVSRMDSAGFVQRIGIYLLNSLACQVNNVQKQLLGDLCAIDKMLQLIDFRVKNEEWDDVLEVAWSTMWNVTDETAINCERFLNGNGMHYFLKCLELFPNKEELLRNMMGLLGNVAEVRFLRHKLMVHDYISMFNKLLNSNSDGIEVSYNAAGVLSHLASDGISAWGADCPDRGAVLSDLVQAIERWDLATERNINYRSFEPILQLARVRHTPQCQHWAVWALANLTKVYPEKYCSLLESEGGFEILQDVLADDIPYTRIKELAQLVLVHCRQFRETGGVNREPQLDG